MSKEAIYLQLYPSSLVGASRMIKLGRSVHRIGYFDQTHLVGMAADGLPDSEIVEPGVSIKRISATSKFGTLGRIAGVLSWQLRVFWRYRTEHVAMVAAHIVWVLPLCWLLARRTGATLIYNAHELETETVAMTGVKKRVAQLLEAFFIRKCTLVSVVNESIADWYEAAYRMDRPIVVRNVPVVTDAVVRLRDRLQIPSGEMLYIHTGYLTVARNIPLVLRAFQSSSRHVLFLGDGPLRGIVISAAETSPNIHWLPPVPPDLVVAYVREADIALCLIEEKLDLSDRLSSPNKLLEALAAGVPPLCSNLVEARRLLAEQADAWILTDPESQLAPVLENIGKPEVRKFKDSWSGLPTWEIEVESLLDAISNGTWRKSGRGWR